MEVLLKSWFVGLFIFRSDWTKANKLTQR